MKLRWPWYHQVPIEVEKAQEKLEQVRRDDVRVDKLLKRTSKLIAENNLAEAVIKALGAQPR